MMRTARDQGWQTQNQIKMLIRMRNREQNLIYREENKKVFLKILIIKERTRIWVISLREFLEIKTLVKVWSWCSVHFHCDHCDCCDLLPISCYPCKTTSVTHDTVGGCPTNKSGGLEKVATMHRVMPSGSTTYCQCHPHPHHHHQNCILCRRKN